MFISFIQPPLAFLFPLRLRIWLLRSEYRTFGPAESTCVGQIPHGKIKNKHANRHTTDLENIVTQSVEQIVCHHANRVDARPWPEQHTRSAKPDGRVVYRVENGHIQLTRIQEWLQNLQRIEIIATRELAFSSRQFKVRCTAGKGWRETLPPLIAVGLAALLAMMQISRASNSSVCAISRIYRRERADVS